MRVSSSTFQLLKSLIQPSTLKEMCCTELKVCLEKHFNPKPSSIVQYFKFNKRIRKSGKSIATYAIQLCAIRECCDFGDTLDLMIRDRLICGINDTRIQRRLFQEPNLTYTDAFKMAQAIAIASRDF